MLLNGDLNPFNENAMRMIDALSWGTTVYLYKPTGVKAFDVSEDVGKDGNDDTGKPAPYDVRFSIISGCLGIRTATPEFHAKALQFLSYKFGEPDDGDDTSCLWEVMPTEAQQNVFNDEFAKSKAGILGNGAPASSNPSSQETEATDDKCDCETPAYRMTCGACDNKMCDLCQTGDQCETCEKYFCEVGDCEGLLISDNKGKVTACWGCVYKGLTLLEEEALKKKYGKFYEQVMADPIIAFHEIEDCNGCPTWEFKLSGYVSVADRSTAKPYQVKAIEAHEEFKGWHDKCPKCLSSVDHHAQSCGTTPALSQPSSQPPHEPSSAPSSQDAEAQAERHEEMLADLARGK